MKRIICMLLVMIFIFPTGIYANEEKPIKVQLNGNYLEFDVQPVTIDNRLMVPFKTIAEKIGVAVDFNNDTQQVTAKKDDQTLIFTIDSKHVDITDKNGTSSLEMDTNAMIMQDRTLVPLRFFAEAFGLGVGWDYSQNTAVLIDYSYFVNKIKNESPNLYKSIGLIKIFKNCENTISANYEVNAISDTFGVNLKAGSSISADIKQDGQKATADVNMLNSGLYNLYTFFVQTQQFNNFDEEQNYITPDFDKPMNLKLMLNDKFTFLKSDFTGLFLQNYNYSYLKGYYIENLKSKWIKFPIDYENYYNEVAKFDKMNVDEKLHYVLKNSRYIWSINDYQKIDTVVSYITELLNNERLIIKDNEDGSTNISLSLDEKVIFNIIMDVINNIEDEEIKEKCAKTAKDYSEVSHYSLISNTTIKDGVILNSETNVTAKLDNIPNPYKMQIGTVEFNYNVKSVGSNIGTVSITDGDFPTDNITTIEQIDEDAKQAKIKHYTDLGFKVDEEGNVDWGNKQK